MFTKVSDVLDDKYVGQEVSVRGWIYRMRSSKNVVFVVLRDSTNTIQATIKNDKPFFSEAEKLTIESSIALTGKIKKDPRAPTGYEMEVEKLEVIGLAEVFPITKDQSTEFLMDVRHLWLRSRQLTNMMKLNARVFSAAREYFEENDFVEVNPPMFITAACEGGSTLFKLDYFGRQAYLTQSSQFYLEALCTSVEKVYCLAPSFRAEKSNTPRHVTEFWHLEAEEAFCGLEGTMKTQEELVAHICQSLGKNSKDLLEYFKRDPEYMKSIETPFERISYDKAIELLQEKDVKIKWGDDLGTEDEKMLCNMRDKPFFISRYAKEAKGFYHRVDPKDPRVVLCADMMAPEGYGETIGGGERIYDLRELLGRIDEAGANPEDYGWYLDLRRYGTVPHSGFGLGMARLLRWICKMENIRDAIPFPRTPNRVYP